MTPLLVLLACGSPDPAAPRRPSVVPAEAVEIRVDARGVHVGDQVVGSQQDLLADPVEGLYDPLVAALAGSSHGASSDQVFVHVADASPWMLVRKLVNSAQRAGAEAIWLGTDDRGWQPLRPVRSRWASSTCEPGSAEVVGLDRAWTLELHSNADGLWALGSARFRPVVSTPDGPVPHDDLPLACWSEASCELGGEHVQAGCADPPPSAPGRVQIAGEWGCLAPIVKQPSDLAGWSAELVTVLETYEIGPEDDVMLIPEANIPFAAIAAVLDAFAARGQRPPTLGMPLVEGNDGPPLCTTAIRDRPALDRAAGAWLGAQLRAGDPAQPEAGDPE